MFDITFNIKKKITYCLMSRKITVTIYFKIENASEECEKNF